MAENARFGIGVSNAVRDIAQSMEIVGVSDRAGLDHFSVSDHPYVGRMLDAYSLVGVALGRTEHISSGDSMCIGSGPTQRHNVAPFSGDYAVLEMCVPAEYETIGSAPGSLERALDALENDHDFLLKGDVFTADVVHYWIKYKRENEVDAIRMRPHPYEFCMYFDI